MNGSIIFIPNVSLGNGARAPDTWESSRGLIPTDDFVVSRDKDGTVLSKYKDPSWDLTPYHPRGRATLRFYLFEDEKNLATSEPIVAEMRYLAFVLIWKRPGSPLKVSTLHNYVNALRYIARFAFRRGCCIKDVLNSSRLLGEFARSEDVSGRPFKVVSALLHLLFQLGPDEVGFAVLGKIGQDILQPFILEYFTALKQYPPIPTRLYSLIISGLSAELDAWESVETRYLSMVKECLNDVLLGKSKNQQINIGTERKIQRIPGQYADDFPALLEKHGLASYFDANQLAYKVQGLVNGLFTVMNVAKLQIITFSGMRNAEARHLPYNCLEEEKTSGGIVHRLILGETTKLQTRRTRWVTSFEGHRAIRIVQRIADVVYKHLGDLPPTGAEVNDRFPLFVSPTYLGLARHSQKAADGTWKAMSNAFYSPCYDNLRARIQPLIEEDDLKELEYIDPHRAWRSEGEFQLGAAWRLTDHQLRRSLALYAQRSGLVSLPSLRRQLQHLTDEMSRYYARGSAFAKNFIGDDKEHFGLEWQEASPVSSGLAFIRDVLFADEPIFGGYVKWIQRRVRGPDGDILLDRDATLRRFRNGELAYKDTPLGGCTKLGPCNEVAIRFLDVDCLGGCPSLVGRLSKLEQTIRAQTALVNRLAPESIEWKIEKADLDVLLETRERVLLQRREASNG